MKKTITAFSIGVIILLSGCTTQNHEVPKGMSSEWSSGYKLGCDSGLSAGGNPYYSFTKDVKKYLEDPIYKDGWDSGFAKCKGSYDAIGRALR